MLFRSIGICGRPLCCHSYLADFVPVSIKMAKEQNLSLNPTKISGMCGRLMCCLKNEEETYEELNKKLPGVGDYVTTADGLRGEVQSVNVLRQLVRVIVDKGDEKEIKEYSANQLQLKRKKGKKEKLDLSREEMQELERLEEEELEDEEGQAAERKSEPSRRQNRNRQGEGRQNEGRQGEGRQNRNLHQEEAKAESIAQNVGNQGGERMREDRRSREGFRHRDDRRIDEERRSDKESEFYRKNESYREGRSRQNNSRRSRGRNRHGGRPRNNEGAGQESQE